MLCYIRWVLWAFVSGGFIRGLLKNEYKIVREGEHTLNIVDKSGNVVQSSKLETTVISTTNADKQMTNILADVRGKRQIGNELVDYDELFKKYFVNKDVTFIDLINIKSIGELLLADKLVELR